MKEILFKTANPRAEEREIKNLEDRFRFQMPQDMKRFYLEHNGGILPYETRIDPESCRLRAFRPISRRYQEHFHTIDELLTWQEMDKFIPMYYIPFCSDEAGDCYYIRVDEGGYGRVYYIFSEFLDDFLENPEENGFIAGSFSAFLEQIEFS